MMGYGGGWGWLMMLVGLVVTLSLLALATVGIAATLNWRSGHAAAPAPSPSSEPTTPQSADDVLDLRYARGEIDAAALRQMRETLRHGGAQRGDERT